MKKQEHYAKEFETLLAKVREGAQSLRERAQELSGEMKPQIESAFAKLQAVEAAAEVHLASLRESGAHNLSNVATHLDAALHELAEGARVALKRFEK